MRDLGDVQQRLKAAVKLDKRAVLCRADDSHFVLLPLEHVGARQAADGRLHGLLDGGVRGVVSGLCRSGRRTRGGVAATAASFAPAAAAALDVDDGQQPSGLRLQGTRHAPAHADDFSHLLFR